MDIASVQVVEMTSPISFRPRIKAALTGLAMASGLLFANPVLGQNATTGASGLPLPRFVSLKSDRVNLRIGPGLSYGVDWLYLKSGVPMEITQEYYNWRRVRDAEGAEGWINQALLSGQRTGIAAPWLRGKDTMLLLRAEPDTSARITAKLQPGVIGRIKSCDGEWCEMEFSGHSGWINQSQIWGAYPDEKIEN
jgi:SH3-like domain-containing protein